MTTNELKKEYFELAQKKIGKIGSVVKILNDYVNVYDFAKESMKKDMNYLHEVYNEGSTVFLEKYENRIISFNEIINQEKQEVIRKIDESINSALSNLEKFMREPISEEARNDIEMIKLLGTNSFSQLEVETLLAKHKSNYLATKVICKLTNAGDKGFHFFSADDLKHEIEAVQKKAYDFCNQYNGTLSYNFALMLEGSALEVVNNNYESFVSDWENSKQERE